MIRVVYLEHSGFLVEFEDAVFIFDYYRGEIPCFNCDKMVYVFASHAHHDHFNAEIFVFRKKFPNIKYILSDDIPVKRADDNIISVSCRQELKLDKLKIKTLRSTDEGVAFLIRYDEQSVYHGGDLNWWHWEEESKAYNEMMRRKYQSEIDKIRLEKIDIAFVPLDSRQGQQFYWGFDYFMKHTDARTVFPMHFWEDYECIERLICMDVSEAYRDRIMRIKNPGQIFHIKGD